MAWWNDPRLDDEGTYDYLVEELPDNSSKWSWYVTKCDDCGKERRLTVTDTSYFYCWDGWDSMSYTTCWKCCLKYKIKSIISKANKNMLKHCRKLNVGAYIVFHQFCTKNNIAKEHRSDLWSKYYDYWADKANYKFLRGMVK